MKRRSGGADTHKDMSSSIRKGRRTTRSLDLDLDSSTLLLVMMNTSILIPTSISSSISTPSTSGKNPRGNTKSISRARTQTSMRIIEGPMLLVIGSKLPGWPSFGDTS